MRRELHPPPPLPLREYTCGGVYCWCCLLSGFVRVPQKRKSLAPHNFPGPATSRGGGALPWTGCAVRSWMLVSAVWFVHGTASSAPCYDLLTKDGHQWPSSSGKLQESKRKNKKKQETKAHATLFFCSLSLNFPRLFPTPPTHPTIPIPPSHLPLPPLFCVRIAMLHDALLENKPNRQKTNPSPNPRPPEKTN